MLETVTYKVSSQPDVVEELQKSKLAASLKFEVLPKENKRRHKSKVNSYCTAGINKVDYTKLTNFVNGRGQMYLYNISAWGRAKAKTQRVAECDVTYGRVYPLQCITSAQSLSTNIEVLYSK